MEKEELVANKYELERADVKNFLECLEVLYAVATPASQKPILTQWRELLWLWHGLIQHNKEQWVCSWKYSKCDDKLEFSYWLNTNGNHFLNEYERYLEQNL